MRALSPRVKGRGIFSSTLRVWLRGLTACNFDLVALRITLAAFGVLAIAIAAAAQQPGFTIHQQDSAPRSGTLEIAPQITPQAKPDAHGAELPSEPVLVIPQASRDFVGRWGGRISLTNVRGHFDPPADTIVGLAFGERKGEVFLRTTVFAAPDANLLKTEAEVLNPREVTLTVVGLEIFQKPTIRHVETVRLRLTDKNQMEVSKDVNLYLGGYPEPMAKASYRGTLHIVSDAEERALDREILERGELPEATVDEHRPAVPPP